MRVRLGRPGVAASVTSAHFSFRPSGVSRTSPSCSSPSSSCAKRFELGVASSARLFANELVGGDTAVVPVDEDGILRLRAGVENVDVNEPSEMSGTVTDDCPDVSPRVLSAADMMFVVVAGDDDKKGV